MAEPYAVKPSRWRKQQDDAVRAAKVEGLADQHIEDWRRYVDHLVGRAQIALRNGLSERRRAIRESLKRERHEGDAARMGNLPPAPERSQHGKVSRAVDLLRSTDGAAPQIVDTAGEIGDPWRGLTLLDDWERSGRITKEMHDAGDRFHALFHLAALDPLAAADMARVGGSRSPVKHRGSIGARIAFHDALDALGGLESMLGSCAWSVLGEERSIRHWAGIYGRTTLGRRTAEMAVSGALGALKVHFGY